MSYLLYCIVRGDQRELRSAGAPIMARCADLGAVLTENVREELEPKVQKLLDYAKVIECYDRERSVIPMRFGCVFDQLAQVSELLERRQDAYRELLSELDGRTEMSICIALDHEASELTGPKIAAVRSVAEPDSGQADGSSDSRSGAGTRYLAYRRRYYAMRESEEESRDELSRRVVKLVQGTFVRSKSEHIKRDGQDAVQVHFLVPRQGVTRFVDALGELKTEKGSKLTISGPWPAYNFASLSEIKSLQPADGR